MAERDQIAWLLRRAGFGPSPGQLDELEPMGAQGVLDRLVDPDAHGVPPAPDPWAGMDLAAVPVGEELRVQRIELVVRWLHAMANTPRPLEERMRWIWHGHFVVSGQKVLEIAPLVGWLRSLGTHALGRLPDLVRAVTVDPGMLMYLDGQTSHRGAINENFGRELLELFTVGVDAHDEDDVRAASTALTGWVVDRTTRTARFVPARHDDSPQRLLGTSGVRDVDTVVAAVTSAAACPRFITRTLADELLGPGVDEGLVGRLADDLAEDGLRIRPLVRSLLEAGMDGASRPMVASPVSWLAASLRATGAPAELVIARAGEHLRAAGQIPAHAPNVGGWPGGAAWLSSATTLARANVASVVAAQAAPDAPALAAAERGDLDALADALGRPGGWSQATADALAEAASGPATVLAAALAAPDLVVT